jgi:hypothetical protein
MGKTIIVFCALSAILATILITLFAVGNVEFMIPKIVVSAVLIDQSVITILYFAVKRVGGPLRLLVRIGSIGVLAGGVLVIGQSAIGWQQNRDFVYAALGVALLVQGALTLVSLRREPKTASVVGFGASPKQSG